MSDRDPKRQRLAEDIATSDVAKEKAAKADEDAALAAKVAAGHESWDIRLRGLLLAAGVMIVVVALTGGALYGLLLFLQSRPSGPQPPSALGLPQPSPPGPRLQTNPLADWQALQATQEAALQSYGWADRSAGTVRIPIDRAIDLLVERGLPVAPGATRQFGDRTPNLDSSGGREPGPTSVAPHNTGQTEPTPTGATPTPSH